MSGTQQDFDKITPEELQTLAPLGEAGIKRVVDKYFGTDDDDSGVLEILAKVDTDPRFLLSTPAEIYVAGFVTALAILDNRQDGAIE